ncbi:MAG: NERD domain-containing protein [Acidobacteriota bacterium]|nr:NERD domain-containing protein [Acidobacteriota bacterium]
MSARRARAPRYAGQHARATVQRLRLRTLIGLGALAVGTAYVGRTLGLGDPIFQTAEITLLLAILVVSHSVLPAVERRERGATGEEHVGTLIEALSDEGWSVLHDLSFGHGNVDHVIIGPPGIFTIETKSHPGPIVVRDIHGATLEQARAQQKIIERLTGEAVEPLLVYSRAWVDRPMARRKGVRVMPSRMLLTHLERRPPTLSGDEIARARRRILAAVPAVERRGPSTRPGRRWSRTRARMGAALRRGAKGGW